MRLLGILVSGGILTGGVTSAHADPEQLPAVAGSVVLERRGSVGLVGLGWGTTYRDERVEVAQGIAALGVRRWVTPFVWLQAGVGAASADLTRDEIDVAPATMFGFGFAVAANEHAVVEVSCHGGTDVVDDDERVYHMSLGLEIRWD